MPDPCQIGSAQEVNPRSFTSKKTTTCPDRPGRRVHGHDRRPFSLIIRVRFPHPLQPKAPGQELIPAPGLAYEGTLLGPRVRHVPD